MRALLRFVRRSIALKLTLTLVGFVAVTSLAAGALSDPGAGELRGGVARDPARLGGRRRSTTRRAGSSGGRGRLPRPQDLAVRVARARPARASPSSRRTAASSRSRSARPATWRASRATRERPEVRAALAGRAGRDLRRSATTEAPLLYVAVPVREEPRVLGVLRLALPLSEVTASYATLHQVMLAGGAVALLVALGIGIFVAGRVTRPVVEMQSIARQMSEGSFLVRAPTRSTDEIGTLGRSLNVHGGTAAREDPGPRAGAGQDHRDAGRDGRGGHRGGRPRAHPAHERAARTMFGLGSSRGEGKPFLEVIRNADLHEIFRAVHAGGAGLALRREIEMTSPGVSHRGGQCGRALSGSPVSRAWSWCSTT